MVYTHKPRGKNFDKIYSPVSVFLAGTIDNGDSIDWQKELTESIDKKFPDKDIDIYNPRRDNWDPELGDDEMNFQIKWELNNLNGCDIIFMNILGDSKSPISLMELGLFGTEKVSDMIVCCPKEFYRYRNVDVVCEWLSVPLHNNYEDAVEALYKKIEEKYGK